MVVQDTLGHKARPGQGELDFPTARKRRGKDSLKTGIWCSCETGANVPIGYAHYLYEASVLA
jgi:hypothetical protein